MASGGVVSPEDGETLWEENEDGISPVNNMDVVGHIFKSTATPAEINEDNSNLATVDYVQAYVTGDVLTNYLTQDEADGIYVQLTKYSTDMANVNSNIRTLTSNQTSLETRVEEDEAENEARATELETNISNVSTRTTQLETDVSGISTRTTQIETKLEDVYMKEEVYNQVEVDEKLDNIQAGVDADLSNYYTKDVLYTKSETYSREQTIREIDKITKVQNEGSDVVGYREWDELKPVIDEDGNPVYDEDGNQVYETIHHKEPVYGDQTESHDFWDTKSGAKICELVTKEALGLPGKIFNRIFIEPKKRRIKTACLAALGALVGTRTITKEICWGVTAANSCTKGGDDDPGDIEFEDDYHGNRTLTNMVHDSEYDSMTYLDEDNKTQTLSPDSTVPTTKAIKNHHYTKDEVDAQIADAVANVQVDLSDYYTKSEVYSKEQANSLFIIRDDGVEILKKDVKTDKSRVLNTPAIVLANSVNAQNAVIPQETAEADTYVYDITIELLHTITEDEETNEFWNKVWCDLEIWQPNGKTSVTYPLDKSLPLTKDGVISVLYGSSNIKYDATFGEIIRVEFNVHNNADRDYDFTISEIKCTVDSKTTIRHYLTSDETTSKIDNAKTSAITTAEADVDAKLDAEYYDKTAIDEKLEALSIQPADTMAINYTLDTSGIGDTVTFTEHEYTTTLYRNFHPMNPKHVFSGTIMLVSDDMHYFYDDRDDFGIELIIGDAVYPLTQTYMPPDYYHLMFTINETVSTYTSEIVDIKIRFTCTKYLSVNVESCQLLVDHDVVTMDRYYDKTQVDSFISTLMAQIDALEARIDELENSTIIIPK